VLVIGQIMVKYFGELYEFFGKKIEAKKRSMRLEREVKRWVKKDKIKAINVYIEEIKSTKDNGLGANYLSRAIELCFEIGRYDLVVGYAKQGIKMYSSIGLRDHFETRKRKAEPKLKEKTKRER